jgi:hypothetical protein
LVITFTTIWSVLCCGHCLRVVPEDYNKDARDLRRQHIALLADLSKNTVTADLAEIVDSVKANALTFLSPLILTVPNLIPILLSWMILHLRLLWIPLVLIKAFLLPGICLTRLILFVTYVDVL